MKKIKLLVLHILFAGYIFAQHPYTFEHYTRYNGLSDNNITDVTEDVYGQIWITTNYGINSFNGKNFKSIICEDSYYRSLIRNDIIFANKDLQGNLWIGGNNGTIEKYNYEKDDFTDVSLNHITLRDYPNFYDTYQAPGSEFYVLSATGLYRYSKYSGKFHKAFREIHDVPGNHFFSMYIDSKKQIWLGSFQKGLFCISADSTQTSFFNFAQGILKTPPKVNVFLPLSDSVFIIGTTQGLFSITHKNFGEVQSKLIYKELKNICINSIIKDKNGNIWIGTDYKGLWIIPKNGNLQRIVSLQSENTLIATITSIFEDSGNRIWIGTEGNGLFCYNPQKQFINQKSIKSGLRNNIVSAIATDKKNNIWVGTDGGGISIYSPDLKLIKQLHSENGLPTDAVLNFVLDDNYMWAATWRGGVIKINTENYKIIEYNIDNSGLLYNGIKTIAWYAKDTLLIGTHRYGLQILYTKENKISSNFGITYDAYYPESQKYINQIIRDKNGVVWVATIHNLYCIKNKKVIDILTDDNNKFPHNPLSVNGISEDSKGYIIAATNKGLYKISQKTFIKENITYKIPELKNSIIFSVFVSKNHSYWITTTNGLYEFDFEKNKYKKINLSPNSNRLFFIPRAIFEDKNGVMYFGTNEGMFSFLPQEMNKKDITLRLQFTNFFIAYEKVIPGNTILPKNLPLLSSIKLPYFHRIWGVSFQSICFDSPETIEYAYMLKGFDKQWNNIKKKQDITFTNIPPGTYTLIIKAWQQNPDNATYKSIQIIILPPWWKTWWVRILFGIFIVAILYIIYTIRLYKLKREKEKLKKEVYIQTLSIAQQKEQIEEQNSELRFVSEKLEENNELLLIQKEDLEDLTKQLQEESVELSELNISLKESNDTKNQLFSIITNDVQNSFKSIQSLSNSLHQDFDIISQSQKKNLISTISQGISSTKDLLENLILWAKNQSNNIEVNPEFCKIDDVLQEIQELFEHVAREKNVSLTITNKNANVFYADKQMSISVLRNVINNCILNTPSGGFVICNVQLKHEMIEFIIQDSGIGINKNIIDSLVNSKNIQIEKQNIDVTAHGLGLIVCHQFIEKNKGNIQIKTSPTKGTTYTILLPAKHAEISFESIKINNEFESTHIQKTFTIALIEDNPAILRLLGDFLQKEYFTKLFTHSSDFMEYIKNEKPHIIISDIFMPEIDGFSLCKELKNSVHTNNIPLILISSNYDDSTKQQAYESGADAFLEKPINNQVLTALVKRMLSQTIEQKNQYSRKNTILFENKFDETFFNKFDELLKQNIANSEFTIEDIAEKLNISRTQLFRKIKQMHSISPKDYFIKIRMQAAAELLQYHDTKIIEIAYATGFSDPSYFSKCFMKHYNISPSDYRNSLLRK